MAIEYAHYAKVADDRVGAEPRLDGGAVITSLAAFAVSTLMIVEGAVHLGVTALSGWPSVAVVLVTSATLTVAFRNRMLKPSYPS